MSNKVGESPKALVDNYRPPQVLNSRVVSTNIQGLSGGHGGGSTHTGIVFISPFYTEIPVLFGTRKLFVTMADYHC